MTALGASTITFTDGTSAHVDQARIGDDLVLTTVTQRIWNDPTLGEGIATPITRYYSPHVWSSVEPDITGGGTLWVSQTTDPARPDTWHRLATEISGPDATRKALEYLDNRFSRYREHYAAQLGDTDWSGTVAVLIPDTPPRALTFVWRAFPQQTSSVGALPHH
ncbi:Uma2 family endonuclease [Mycobacteroides abscessus]|uniref:Uma2 family endonuclease n=1 Tax=Mycobacteroides abscessus TaxID=36809 RepID=UPI0012FFF639|nr:Uma2 family endonuclease [Mycobacteroides abscessus]